jgi:hypothetical protein
MLSRKQRVGIGIGAAVVAVSCALLWGTRDDSPEARTRRALHDLRLTDGWGRKLHAALWARMPDFVVNQLSDCGPADLDKLHLEAAQALGALAPHSAEAVTALCEAVQERNNTRIAAAQALGAIGPFATNAIEPLLKAAEPLPPGHVLRETIYESLCAIAPTDQRVTSAFLRQLHSGDDAAEIFDLMQRSAKLYDEGVRQALWQLWDESAELRPGLARVLGHMNMTDDERDLLILACIRDADPGVRLSALNLLLEKPFAQPEIIAELRNSLLDVSSDPYPPTHTSSKFSLGIWWPTDPNYYHVATVIQNLGSAGQAAWEVTPLLLDLIDRGHPSQELNAAVALWEINDDDSNLRLALAKALAANSPPFGRQKALQTLRALTPRWPGTPDFWRLALQHDDKSTRYGAVCALALLGDEARWALPYLRELLTDRSPGIRDEAAKAIARIQ